MKSIHLERKPAEPWRRYLKHLQFIMEMNGIFQEVSVDEILFTVQLSGYTFTSFVRCCPISRVNEGFCDCHLPFTKFLWYICMEWIFLRISIIIVTFGNCTSVWKDSIFALLSWIRDSTWDIWYPKSSSLITLGISLHMNSTLYIYKFIYFM